jgi:hypothetical protein
MHYPVSEVTVTHYLCMNSHVLLLMTSRSAGIMCFPELQLLNKLDVSYKQVFHEEE